MSLDDDRLRSHLRTGSSYGESQLAPRLPTLKAEIIRRSRRRRVAKALATCLLSVVLLAGVVSGSVVALNSREPAKRLTEAASQSVQVSSIEMTSVGPLAASSGAIVVDSGNTFADPLEGLSSVDPSTQEVTDLPPVTLGGDQMTFDGDSFWITGGRGANGSGWLEKVDASGSQKLNTLRLPGGLPNGVAIDGSGIWVGNLAGNFVWHVAPDGTKILAQVTLGASSTDIVSAFGSIWATTNDGFLIRLEPRTGNVTFRVAAGVCPHSIASGEGSIWVVDPCGDSVRRFNPDGGALEATIRTSRQPIDIVLTQGVAWVASASDDSVDRIDAGTNEKVGSSIPVGSRPNWMLVAFGDIWTANIDDETISRISL